MAHSLDFSGPNKAAFTRVNQNPNPNNPTVKGNPKKYFKTGWVRKVFSKAIGTPTAIPVITDIKIF